MIKPLETNRKVLIWLCLCPADKGTSNWMKFAYFIRSSFTVASLAGNLIASACYFLKYVKIDQEQSLYGIFQVFGAISLLYGLIALLLTRNDMEAIFDRLTDIYHANENHDSFRIIAHASATGDWIWRNFFKLMAFAMVSIPIASGGSVVLSYMWRGSYDNNYLYHPFAVVLPFDQTTPMGYFGEMIFVCSVAESYILANAALLILFVSICLHHRAFYKFFKYWTQKLGTPHHNCRVNEAILARLVCFHTSVTNWFKMTAQLYSSYILVHLIADTILLAGLVYQFDSQLKHIDFNILTIIQSALCVAPSLFVYCYFGKLATESYANIANELYSADWPNLPVKLQKHVLLMITNAQQSHFYDGFGVAILNLQTFMSLVRAIYSSYAAFKTVAE